MLKEMKYGALSSKTRAMFGKLLNHDDYRALMQKRSVYEVVSYLKANTHFRTILANVDEADIHRIKLEYILKHDLLNDYAKLLNFTNGRLKIFVNLLYTKIEIESLKLIFRVFEAGSIDQQVLEHSLLFMANHDKLNIPKLALSRNVEEFLLGLKDTPYYDVLRPYASKSNETRLFSMEMALDLYYLRNVQDTFKHLLNPKDAAIIKEFAGLESDAFNIFWIFRSKTFHHMDVEVIRSYTLPLIYKLKKSTMEALLEAKNLEEYVDILKDTYYGFLFKDSKESFIEHNYAEFIYRLHRTRFRRQPFTIACVISYLRMKEVELSNIISIIEGIRYRLPEEKIQSYLVGVSL